MYHKIVRKHVRLDALNIAKETKSGQVPLYIKYIDKIKVFIYINAFKIILSEVWHVMALLHPYDHWTYVVICSEIVHILYVYKSWVINLIAILSLISNKTIWKCKGLEHGKK